MSESISRFLAVAVFFVRQPYDKKTSTSGAFPSGMSLRQVAEKHGISRASVCRLTKEAGSAARVMSETALAA
jgi:hypothetical protein